ncbi:MAG: CoA transferase [Pseudomonadota bacterium]
MTDPDAIPEWGAASTVAGPLRGVRVVDFTHVLAGPACAYHLALLGADVIKVERPGRGDAMRHRGGSDPERAARGESTAFLTQNGHKRSVEIDLDGEAGQSAMQRLLGDADVLVENHRPTTLRRLGLDWETLHAQHSRLVHCAMTGYGRGHAHEDAPAYDVNIQAASGLMSLTGSAQSGPTRVGAPVIDYATALAAAFGVCAALLQRARTGKGALVDVSMMDVALTLMSSTVVDFALTGNVPRPRGNAANSRSPSAGTFPTADGLLSLGVNEEAQFARLALALDRKTWLSDATFATARARDNNREQLSEAIEDALRARTAREWEGHLLAAGVPAARVATLPEALESCEASGRRHTTFLGGRPSAGHPFSIR